MKSPEEILEDLEEAEDARSKALAEARRERSTARTLGEMRDEIGRLRRAVEVLDEHLSVRTALREAIAKPPVLRPAKKGKGDPIIPVAFQSDEHYDEEFTLEQTGGLNEQNPEIAEEKVATYTKRLIRLIEREALDNPVPYIVVPLMGDMMTGGAPREGRAML